VLFKETSNCERYVQVILGQFLPELTEEHSTAGFKNAARMSMQVLSDVFGDRIISGGIWPARSPDLNPCDFFFWGGLKDKDYNSNSRTEELEENIGSEFANISA
jgi:hypothetical protein